MRAVYSPANSAEAHMLAHLLEQNGIKAYVHGEQLQGAVGDLPASGLLQLMTADEDYDAARALVLKWERDQPKPETPGPSRRPSLWPALIGVLCGIVFGWFLKDRFVALPIDASEVWQDDNEDGDTDSWVYFRVGATSAYKVEEDNNFDGEIDFVSRFGPRGAMTRQDGDADFDGVLETRTDYRLGNATRTTTDEDNDGRIDSIMTYRDGIPRLLEERDPSTGRPVRVDYYDAFRQTHSDHDLDRDGFLETRRIYDRFGEIVRTETIQRSN